MKKVFLFIVVSCIMHSLSAVGANWFRNNQISPDGTTIVFTYKGDLFTVSSMGGKAIRLTSNPAYDGNPCWSPDGKKIAFSSDRYGNMDVFVVDAHGGAPKRLTTHTSAETVEGWLDNTHVLYTAAIQADVNDIVFPTGFKQVWEVDVDAHRPKLFSSITMESMSINEKGEILYQNNKGYENEWRKHHRSPITRDIYLTQIDKAKRTYTKLSKENYEHRNPRWDSDGNTYYYLSEKDGTINIYKTYKTSDSEQQLTTYKNHPVRYLSIANNGTLCYSWDGNIYTLQQGGKPKQVAIEIVSDDNERINLPSIETSGVKSFCVSKDEKEIIFALNGDIYAKSMDYETTRRITKTPVEEGQPTISPDGRTIVFTAERNGKRNLYSAKLINKADKLFTYATDIKEEQLTNGTEPCILPKFSPDGKKIAFLANKTEIRVMDVASKKISVALPAKFHFSYSDGDVDFEWSPDSKWILTSYMGENGWNNMDIAAVSADGKKVVNLTNSGYTDDNAHWALGGKAIVWASDRAGYRSHGSWGAEYDAYIMFLDRELYNKSRLNKEDRALFEERSKVDTTELKDSKKKEGTKEKKKEDKAQSTPKKDSIEIVKLDFDGCEDRVMRLTNSSSSLGDFMLNAEGTKFYYTARFDQEYDLYEMDLEKHSTRVLKKGISPTSWIPNAKKTAVYMRSRGLQKLTLATGDTKPLPFKAEVEKETAEQREFIFDHCVQQIVNRFCETDYHGVDFKALAEHYRQFLPEIANSKDLSEMVSELLGELNCSHTGLIYRASASTYPTANLGVFYDDNYEGNGLKIAEVIAGGPLDLPNRSIKPGCVITQIDHNPIKKNEDYYPLLAGKAGKWVLLTLNDPKGNPMKEVYVKACSQAQLNGYLYKRWVKRNADITKELTKGEIGYVHIKSMDSESFRKVYSEVLGKYRNCKAIVVDERHNGGGWLHGDLAVLLSGQQFQTYTSRGQQLGGDPFTRWNRPSCVLVCEDCYSNAHGFPAMYKYLKLGKLVGTPVAGTMTAVWWEHLVDSSLTLGIPEVNCLDMNGKPCENQQLDPDVPSYLNPADQLRGNDTQLKDAIKLMLETIK